MSDRARPGARKLFERGRTCAAIAVLGATVSWLAPTSLLAQDALRPPTSGNYRADEVVVRPGDMLRISVWPQASLGGEFPVEESGYVYLPILGEVPVANLSLGELRARLREGYSQDMKNPVVTVTPLFRVSVLGAVARPALYSVDPTHTLYDVIGMAGGFTAPPEKTVIRLVRGSQVYEIGGRQIAEGMQDGETFLPRSGDRIFVVSRAGNSGQIVRTATTILNAAVLIATLAVRLNR